MFVPRPWYVASLLAPWLCLAAPLPTLAQITPDATLGAEGSVVTPEMVQGAEAELIEGGAVRDGNLFHSFLEFNIDDGQRVYFANPAGIESILSRVTGGNPSNIFGTLGVDGAADLFLINPNGIVFGENATLDIQGSFYASTAEAIALGNGVYSATEPEQSSLLTVNPSALFSSHLSDASGDIQNRGQLAAQENLTLAANNLDLQGQVAAGSDLTLLGLDTVQIRDTADTPFVGFARGDLLVQGNEAVDIVALGHPDSGLYSYGDMVLRSGNPVGGDAHYWSGGSFRVENLDGEAGGLFSPIDPIIRSFGDVVIDQYEGQSLHILAGGSVSLGTVTITGADDGILNTGFLRETIVLNDGTVVQVDGAAQPTLDVRAGVRPEAIGTAPLVILTGFDPSTDTFTGDAFVTDTPSTADITIGDASIAAPDGLVLLTNQYQPNTALAGGNIVVTGDGLRGVGIDARGFNGQGGAVYLDARNNVSVTNSSILTTGAGDVGDVVINAGDTVRFEREDRPTGVASNLAAGATGTGGNIRISATNVELFDGAALTASTFGDGDAGNIDIDASETVVFDGTSADGQFSSAAFSRVESDAEGDGGDVVIRTGSLDVTNGAGLTASTRGTGNAGNVGILARDRVVFDGTSADGQSVSIADSRVESDAEGDGGNVVIRTGSLDVTNGAALIASTEGIGDAGSVDIEARDNVIFDGTSADGQFSSAAFSRVESDAEGDGGNVVIRTGSLDVKNGARLTASTRGTGNAGNVGIEARDSVVFDNGTAFSTVEAGAEGDGGNVVILSGSLDVTNGAELQASTKGTGDAGNVRIEARDSVVFDDGAAFSTVESGAIGDGGNVLIRTDSLDVKNGARLTASTRGTGNAGNVGIEARDRVVFDNGTAFSTVESEAVGDGGNVVILSGSLEVTNGAQLQASTKGTGDAGNVRIEARDRVVFDNSVAFSTVEPEAVGDGGNVLIRNGSLDMTNGAALTASTRGTGDAGNVVILSDSLVKVTNGARLIASTGGTGDAGNVDIEARDRVVFDNGAAFSTVESEAVGDGGDVVIRTGSLDVKNGARLTTSTEGTGDAGNVVILSDSLVKVTNGARLIASTGGTGDAGNVGIVARDRVVFDNGDAFSTVESGAVGDGGNVVISTGSLDVINGAGLIARTRGTGDAGNVDIEARDSVVFDGTNADGQSVSGADSRVGTGAVGNGGNVVIRTGSLDVTNGAQLIASTEGIGDAGSVDIEARDNVIFDGTSADGQFSSAAFSTVEAGAEGDGGDVVIFTGSLEVTNGAGLTASTRGTGNAGNVGIEARDQVNLQGTDSQGNPSGIFAGNTEVSTGRSNRIQIVAPELLVQDGAVILASTTNDQPGGDINLDLGRLAVLNGGQVVTGSLGAGPAGTVRIDATEDILITGSDPNFANRVEQIPETSDFVIAQSAVSVQSSGDGTAGNIIIGDLGATPRLELNDEGRIIAESATGDGGNIDINLNNVLLLRNGSLISTDAGTEQAGGDGGNITIAVPFIVAIPEEDSNITANAFEGTGGNVNITARGIFGIEPRPQRTPLSDITASSELGVSGTVAIDALDTSFIETSLTNLEDVITDTAALTAGSCIARADDSLGDFVVTGSGGLPQRPGDSGISAYPTGTVRTLTEPTATLQEPDGVYQLPNGRLVLSHACE